jgi:uncharacterized protein (DUF2235 family)
MRRLVLCCDGTWNRADQEDAGKPCPTNVIKFAYRLAKKPKDKNGQEVDQIIYYDQGVGTGDLEDKILGGATGAGLEQNIHDAYIFLIANYEPGDEIYIVGFSRGAFTARSIGGMIHKCGIIKREFVEQYINAERMYHDADVSADSGAAKTFRQQYSIDDPTPVQMIGVWDTVGALGIPLRGLRAENKKEYQFLDTDLNPQVKYAFHALAIDEHRSPFEPTLWTPANNPGQVVEQVWFPGVHSDVGGGYKESDLSDSPLEWMMGCAVRAGLVFEPKVIALHATKPKPEGKIHDSMTLVYRVEGKFERPIEPDKDSTQSIHQSVIDRWNSVPDYRPKNLDEYLQKVGGIQKAKIWAPPPPPN